MNKVKLAVSTYLAVVGVLSVSSADASPLFVEMAPQAKIDACVAEVSANADYTGATRVRHSIESKQRHSRSHTLYIDTQVLGENDDSVIREYATVCVAPKGDRPVRIRINESS